jgi:hypothetical protein
MDCPMQMFPHGNASFVLQFVVLMNFQGLLHSRGADYALLATRLRLQANSSTETVCQYTKTHLLERRRLSLSFLR